MLLLICHSFVPVVLLSFIFSQVVTSQFELRWSRCMLIWVYPENCVSYIWPDKHIKTHTYNKANTLSAWSLSFSLTPVLEDSSSQTTFCPLVFLILHCFLSAFISVIPVHQVRTKNHWHVSDTEECCDCFSSTAMKKSWESCWPVFELRDSNSVWKRKVVLSPDIKKHITLTKYQHMQLTITWFMKKTMSLYTVALSAFSTVATAGQLGQYH